MSDTQPHIELLLAETCLLIGILSSACVPCYFICIEYSRFQLFLNSALFFPDEVHSASLPALTKKITVEHPEQKFHRLFNRVLYRY